MGCGCSTAPSMHRPEAVDPLHGPASSSPVGGIRPRDGYFISFDRGSESSRVKYTAPSLIEGQAGRSIITVVPSFSTLPFACQGATARSAQTDRSRMEISIEMREDLLGPTGHSRLTARLHILPKYESVPREHELYRGLIAPILFGDCGHRDMLFSVCCGVFHLAI